MFYSFAIILILLSSNYSSVYFSYGAYSKAQPSPDGPTINDDSLAVEKVTSDLTFPTSMTFVGNNDILVTEKNTERIIRVLDGQVQDNPLLDLSVSSKTERRLLGIAASKHLDGKILFSCPTLNLEIMRMVVMFPIIYTC